MRIADSAIVALCIVLLGAGVNNAQAGGASVVCPPLAQRIMHGAPCAVENSPVVQLDIGSSEGEALCTGTIISPRYVLTAGHCLQGKIYSVRVRAAGDALMGEAYAVHPKYRPMSYVQINYDVALVRVRGALRPAPLGIARTPRLRKGSIVSIYGYGLDEAQTTGVLRGGVMKLTSVTTLHLIARYVRSDSNTCNGDSGGPAVLGFKDTRGVMRSAVVGVTSTGADPHCAVGDVSWFSNVRAASIVSFVRKHVPEVKVY